MEHALIDQLDQYIKGTLASPEIEALEDKMNSDSAFKEEVEKHIKFIKTLQRHGNRETLKKSLDTCHEEIVLENKSKPFFKNTNTSVIGIKKYWTTLAVAAAVAFISVLGTLIATQSLEKKHKADYKELRRNVEQIKKSQKALMADIKEVKEKDDLLPGNYAGTGFLLSTDGYVATSYHVIKDADSLYLENKKFGRLKVSVIKADQKEDVAILKIEQAFNTSVPYTIYTDEAAVGEKVFTLGFPREDIVYGEGTISASTGYGRNEKSYQIAVPVNPGNSGGPLLNQQGQLVGIVSGIQTETQGAAFAVKSSVLLSVIGYGLADSLSLPIALPKQNKLKNLNRIDQIKKLQDYVFVVKVYNGK